jgi:hypothetical protein
LLRGAKKMVADTKLIAKATAKINLMTARNMATGEIWLHGRAQQR